MKNLAIFFFLFLIIIVSAPCKNNPPTDFYFEANKEFTEITIYRYDGKTNNVVIPSEIEGIPVTAIDSFFAPLTNPTKIKSVIIPDTVKRIGKEAFSQCTELKTVKLSNNLETIGRLAFFMDDKLEIIVFPESLKVIDENAFAGCKSLKKAELKNVEFLGMGAFNSTNLNSVSLPSSLKYIGSNAFGNCDNIESINIPDDFPAIYFGNFNKPGEYSLKEVFSGKKINTSIALQKQISQTKMQSSKEALETASKKYNVYIPH